MSTRRSKFTFTLLGETLLKCSKLGISVCLPCRVVTYNPILQKVDVQMQNLQVLNQESGKQELLPSLVSQCPIAFQSSSGGTANVQFPILPGDPGYLLIADRSLERWITQGVPVDPASGQAHSIIDGIFHPALRSNVDTLVPPVNPAALTIEALLIHLGNGAVSPAVLGTELLTAINAYVATTTSADSVLAGLAATWAGVPGGAQVAYALGHAPWILAKTQAQSALITALVLALSLKTSIQ